MAEKDDHHHLEMPEELKVEFPQIDTAVGAERLEKSMKSF